MMRAITPRALAGILLIASAGALLLDAPPPAAVAQPTYKLDVKPHLKPLATIKLDGQKVTRTELSDDPGFRLQFHVKQVDGKTVTTVEARSTPSAELPTKSPGSFSVVLELFYPAYKGGTGQKGEFKPVSNVLTYKVDGGKVTLIDAPAAKKDQPAKQQKDKK